MQPAEAKIMPTSPSISMYYSRSRASACPFVTMLPAP